MSGINGANITHFGVFERHFLRGWKRCKHYFNATLYVAGNRCKAFQRHFPRGRTRCKQYFGMLQCESNQRHLLRKHTSTTFERKVFERNFPRGSKRCKQYFTIFEQKVFERQRLPRWKRCQHCFHNLSTEHSTFTWLETGEILCIMTSVKVTPPVN